MEIYKDLLRVDEDATDVCMRRAGVIFTRLATINSHHAFLEGPGKLNKRFISAVLSSCMIPAIRDTVLQHNMRGLVAQATFSVGDMMTLWDAVPYYCWQRTPRERTLIRQMMRSVYIEYDQDSDVRLSVCYLLLCIIQFHLRSTSADCTR